MKEFLEVVGLLIGGLAISAVIWNAYPDTPIWWIAAGGFAYGATYGLFIEYIRR